jgi:uncharacterized membrane protein (UPF0136 family)
MGKPQQRADWTFGVAIVLGLLIGIAIKKVRIGLLVGIVLGIFLVWSGWLSQKRKMND